MKETKTIASGLNLTFLLIALKKIIIKNKNYKIQLIFFSFFLLVIHLVYYYNFVALL